MSEYEPQNRFTFPWQENEVGESYLTFQNGDMTFEINRFNTCMYIYPDQPKADHVWVQLEDGDDVDRGIRLWRLQIDKLLGSGVFGILVDNLFERDFECSDDEEPSELDIEAWERTFNEKYTKPNPIDKLVELALKNFDSAWKYYEQEWSS